MIDVELFFVIHISKLIFFFSEHKNVKRQMKSMDDAGVKYRDSRKSQGKPILQTKQQNSKLQNDDSIDFGKKKIFFYL